VRARSTARPTKQEEDGARGTRTEQEEDRCADRGGVRHDAARRHGASATGRPAAVNQPTARQPVLFLVGRPERPVRVCVRPARHHGRPVPSPSRLQPVPVLASRSAYKTGGHPPLRVWARAGRGRPEDEVEVDEGPVAGAHSVPHRLHEHPPVLVPHLRRSLDSCSRLQRRLQPLDFPLNGSEASAHVRMRWEARVPRRRRVDAASSLHPQTSLHLPRISPETEGCTMRPETAASWLHHARRPSPTRVSTCRTRVLVTCRTRVLITCRRRILVTCRTHDLVTSRTRALVSSAVADARAPRHDRPGSRSLSRGIS
jgi:hypothetical protein